MCSSTGKVNVFIFVQEYRNFAKNSVNNYLLAISFSLQIISTLRFNFRAILNTMSRIVPVRMLLIFR